MKITHFCNSFIAVEEGETRLACDPWIGACNYGGWLSYPISGGEEEILRRCAPTHLYISHLHPDHFCERVLDKMPDKRIPVIIKAFEDKVLYRRLKALGFGNVVELPSWEFVRISEDFEVAIIPADISNTDGLADEIAYDLDTSILIRSLADETAFFNGVDNPMSLEHYRKVREFAQEIDVACIAVGASSEYPQCFLGIDRESEKARVIESSLKRFSGQLKALEAEAYFPAGGTYVIPGKFSMLNRYIAQPSMEQLRVAVSSSRACKAMFYIEGGNSIEKVGGKWARMEGELKGFSSRADAIQAHGNLKYEYVDIPPLDENYLETVFSVARQRYLAKLKALSIDIRWKVVFQLYTDLRLDDNGCLREDCRPFKTLTLSGDTAKEPPYELVCHLDRQLFSGLLKRKCIWNSALSGSVILFERTPNVFIPAIPFSLNYFAL